MRLSPQENLFAGNSDESGNHEKKITYCLQLALVTGIALLFSCIETFTPELKTNDTKSLLVVEGRITDQEGPFKVRLTESVPDLIEVYYDHPVYGAEVQLSDDKGNVFNLYETDQGWYETENKSLKGVPGNTYTLNITMDDGTQYESSPELMHETPDVEKVYYEELKKTRFDDLEVIEENRVNILVDSKPPEEEDICLLWQFEETWRFVMPSHVLVNHGMGEFSPPPTVEDLVIDSTQKYCFVTEPSRKILVESPVGYKEKGIRRFVLQPIGPDSDRLNYKYSILVKQYTISKEIYNILNKLHEANTGTEGIYSRNPGQVFGNISNCETGEKVLGYFIASAMKSKRIFIDHSEVDVNTGSAYDDCGWTTSPPRDWRGELIQDIFLYGTYERDNGTVQDVWSTDAYCADCRERGYNEQPDFWE
jgi:hypothetical protein